MVQCDIEDTKTPSKTGISSHSKLQGTIIGLTHNQVVPGSSPGGTTNKDKPYRDVRLFYF